MTQSKLALQLSPDRVFGGLVSFGGNLWMYGGFSRLIMVVLMMIMDSFVKMRHT